MIDPYLVDTVVVVKKPATDKFGSEIAPPEEISTRARVDYETRAMKDVAGNEVVSTANVYLGYRELSHEDRLRFDGEDHGIIRISKVKSFGSPFLRVYVA